MKKTHLVFLFCILLACTKSSVDTNKIQLQGIIVTNTNNADTSITFIEYDTQGRIISLSDKINGGASTNRFNISYVNDEILIKPPTRNDLREVSEVRCTVNSDGLPVKRIEYYYSDFNNVGTNQVNKHYDTTRIEYSAGGLLLKKTKSMIDTMVYIPPGLPAENSLEAHTLTTVYNSDNNIMKSFFLTDLYTYTKKVGANTNITKSSNEISASFEYLKNYNNKLDYSNTVVMNECIYIFNDRDYLNNNYTNLPDKVIKTSTAKDGNGNITSSYNYTSQVELIYNTNGFLSVIKKTENGNTNTKTFIYNK